MIKTEIYIGKNRNEYFPEMKEGFPYSNLESSIGDFVGGCAPWHWHEEIEFTYVASHSLTVQIKDREYILKKGDACCINSNVLHQMKPSGPKEKTVLLTQVCKPSFLTGREDSVLYSRYMAPYLNSRNAEIVLLFHEKKEGRECIEKLNMAYQAAQEEKEGYEFEVRALLTQCWMIVRGMLGEREEKKTEAELRSSSRIWQMMQFIHENYGDKLTLEEIADSANVSTRECLRCFQKHIRMAPFAYLMEYRLQQASIQLLVSDDSVTQIAQDCGFLSSSYFGKHFKQYFRCTPLEYRRTQRLGKT